MNKLEEHFRRIAGTEQVKFYAILDGAAVPNLLDKLYADGAPRFECLYRGELEPDMAEVAPYLVELDLDGEFFHWLLSGTGQAWGIYCYCDAALDLAAVRRHFRKLNVVSGPDGKMMMFRYYDPRVLAMFLPICSPDQLILILAGVRALIAESLDGRQAVEYCRSEAATLISRGI